MGRHCIVRSCRNRKGEIEGTVHAFPVGDGNQILRKRWIAQSVDRVNIGRVNLDYFGVCSDHFRPDDYKADSIFKPKGLRQFSFPTLLLPQDVEEIVAMEIDMELHVPEIEREAHVSENELEPDVLEIDLEPDVPENYLEPDVLEIDLEPDVLEIDLEPDVPENYLESDVLEISIEFQLPEIDHDSHEQEIDNESHIPENLRKELQSAKVILDGKNKQIRRLQRRITRLEHDAKNQKLQADALLSRFFTVSQIRILKGGFQNYIHWEEEDISKALALYSISNKSYAYMKDVLKYPLPSESTLKRWLQKISINPGKLITPVLHLLEMEFHSATAMQKACVLAVDEVEIDPEYCYDVAQDQIYGGKNTTSVISIRGLFYPWKQIIYYDWEDKLTTKQLLQTISSLNSVGLNVCSLVSDMGPKNQGIWKALGVGQVKMGKLMKTWFLHPVTGKRVWVFPDFPHLLKLLRNHLLDSGIYFPSGEVIDKDLFEKLLDIQKGEFCLTEKLTHKHLYMKGKQRQDVKSAFQLFSNKVSKAIAFAIPGKQEQSQFVGLINNFSDLMNSRTAQPHHDPYKAAYGMHLEKQNDLLNEAHKTFSEMIVGKKNRRTLVPFQKGMLMCIESLQGLFEDMKKEVDCKYIMTSRINQDYLENIFSQMRGLGGFKNNPNALEMKYRIKKLICSWKIPTPQTSGVAAEDSTTMISSNYLAELTSFQEHPVRTSLLNEDTLDELTSINWTPEVTQLTVDHFTLQGRCEEGGTEYVAGYIAKKLMESYPELCKQGADETRSPFWVGSLSNHSLVEPSLKWHGIFKKMDEIFRVFHPEHGCSRKPGVIKFVEKLLKDNYRGIPTKVIEFFAKSRTLLRIKYLNRKIEDDKFLKQESRRQSILDSLVDDDVPAAGVDDVTPEINLDSLLLVNEVMENLVVA